MLREGNVCTDVGSSVNNFGFSSFPSADMAVCSDLSVRCCHFHITRSKIAHESARRCNERSPSETYIRDKSNIGHVLGLLPNALLPLI